MNHGEEYLKVKPTGLRKWVRFVIWANQRLNNPFKKGVKVFSCVYGPSHLVTAPSSALRNMLMSAVASPRWKGLFFSRRGPGCPAALQSENKTALLSQSLSSSNPSLRKEEAKLVAQYWNPSSQPCAVHPTGGYWGPTASHWGNG